MSDEGGDDISPLDDVSDTDRSSDSDDPDGLGSWSTVNRNGRHFKADDGPRLEVHKAVPASASPVVSSMEQLPSVIWEEIEPFVLDESFDYENCPRMPRPDLAQLAKAYAARKAAGEVASLNVFK